MANPQLPVKYKLTYFDRSDASSSSSKTSLSRKEKKQMLKEIFGQKKGEAIPDKEEENVFEELRENEEVAEPEYEEYEE